jgi:ergothioneine biosynthesis protein EgtB
MIERIHEARQETDRLFDLVKPEALYDRPLPERHRLIFYVGHLEAFDRNLLSGPLGLESSEPEFDRLFAFGIDPVGGGLPTDTPGDWPSIDQVLAYRSRVREKLDAANLRRADCQLLHVALEHRLMHAETLAYMLHQLPLERKLRVDVARSVEAPEVVADTIEIPEEEVTLGLARDAGAFGWDNEFDSHAVHVPAFTIDRYKVTNGQFARFVAEGGYDHRAFWTDEDWEWKSRANIGSPVFWLKRNGAWWYRTMFDEIPLPLAWPAYVSHAEARAYARWAGKALPTEAQWQRSAQGVAPVSRPLSWDPLPVNSTGNRSAYGVEGLFGNGWEWTSTPFAPFDGFEPFSFYRGYSADFFDGKHFVMKGGSPLTADCLLRPSFRNWFQPHYQYVYAGFRCVGGR